MVKNGKETISIEKGGNFEHEYGIYHKDIIRWSKVAVSLNKDEKFVMDHGI